MATKKTSPAKKKTVPVPQLASEQRWMARDDLRTIQQANEIQNDPKRMKAAQAEAQSQIAALSKVAKK